MPNCAISPGSPAKIFQKATFINLVSSTGSMEYELELEKAISAIKEKKAKTVCIQMPDGLRPEATKIAAKLSKETGAEVFIWADSCYGACDIPKLENVDLLIQWGNVA